MLRKFKLSDLERILEIEQQSFPKSPWSRLQFLYCYKKSPDGFLVYELGKKIVGYVVFNQGHIQSLAVDPSFRRRKIGTKLVQAVSERWKGDLRVEVRKSNLVAQKFYKKLGFEKVGEIPNYYEDEDALILVRKSKKV